MLKSFRVSDALILLENIIFLEVQIKCSQVKAQKNPEILIQHATVEDAAASQSSKSLEGSKILYILVQDDPEPGAKEGEQGPCHRYTRPLLTSTLQLMGCKPRHAIKVWLNDLFCPN